MARVPYYFLLPGALILIAALIYPVGYVFYASFLDWHPSQTIGQADFIGIKNYINLLYDENFRSSFFLTLRFTVLVVSIEMALGIAIALFLDQKIWGMSVLRATLILPMLIAPIVVGLIWRFMYYPSIGSFNQILTSLGFKEIPWLFDSFWSFVAIIIADIWQWTPFVIILTLSALQYVPRSVIDAAKIDGASVWQRIFYIKIPIISPILIVIAILRLIDAFKVLEVILILTNGGPGVSTEVMSLHISRTINEYQDLGIASAMSVYLLFTILVLTLLMLLVQKLKKA